MLPENFQLEVVTPERRVIHATATSAQVPAQDGYLGILPGHAPLLSAMGVGELSYREGAQTYYAAVIGGYVEVLAGRVIVLAEAAERAEEISVDRARAAKQKAEKILATPQIPNEEATAAREALTRAEVRLKVAAHASGSIQNSALAMHTA
jgi:F-type H+-transporting ATPase subunit epsilon